MSFNKSWPRWIFASVAAHFRDKLAEAKLPLFVEGQHRDTRKLPDFAELRFEGPKTLNLSKGCWRLRIEINVLVQSVMNDTNAHNIHENVGVVAGSFSDPISVYRKGNRPGDDQSFVGCLQLLQNSSTRDYLEINHFGQIEQKVNLQQATVEGHYFMLLEE